MFDHDELKHLEMIQTVIARLAGNSFLIKGWSVGLVSILCALAAKDINVRFAILALLPALSFWGLDAYYLRQEKLFRRLYDSARIQYADHRGTPKIALFSMDTSSVAGAVDGWTGVLISKTILATHLPILIAVLSVVLYAAESR